MKKIVFGTAITLAILFTGCSENEDKESAEVKQAKEIMAKNIIKEEEKEQKQKELRVNGQGDFSNAK
ncbi:hypothetical protein H0A43_03450 [Arcobacter lanthieri]|uniref:hypothetical protein n=1 Tax=Aliarcobacter lanthieri TaxID=1355374 RepID=UPI001924D0E6|nr:hypothetical protein [Aliarcobacter lanthieri]MBL3519513.1 hypothetical protein [Aliarcobacter lanthieri]